MHRYAVHIVFMHPYIQQRHFNSACETQGPPEQSIISGQFHHHDLKHLDKHKTWGVDLRSRLAQ